MTSAESVEVLTLFHCLFKVLQESVELVCVKMFSFFHSHISTALDLTQNSSFHLSKNLQVETQGEYQEDMLDSTASPKLTCDFRFSGGKKLLCGLIAMLPL